MSIPYLRPRPFEGEVRCPWPMIWANKAADISRMDCCGFQVPRLEQKQNDLIRFLCVCAKRLAASGYCDD